MHFIIPVGRDALLVAHRVNSNMHGFLCIYFLEIYFFDFHLDFFIYMSYNRNVIAIRQHNI